jgi:pimeloyl-ACP methyl ester carboxylesterase
MSRRINGPAGTLMVDDGGERSRAEAIVFVHSLAGAAAHWSAQIAHVRPSRRAVAFDLRGHGASELADGDFAMDALAGDIGAVADALGLERFALVGHSLGAGVALAFAGAHPDRVSRLFLLDPIADGTQIPAEQVQPFLTALRSSSYHETIEGYWSTISGPNPAVRERLLRDLRATPRDSVIEGFTATTQFDPKPAFASYRGPALAVVTPSNDFPFSLHRLTGGPPHRVIEGTGHWIQLDKPEDVNGMLEQFLNARREKGEGRRENKK